MAGCHGGKIVCLYGATSRGSAAGYIRAEWRICLMQAPSRPKIGELHEEETLHHRWHARCGGGRRGRGTVRGLSDSTLRIRGADAKLFSHAVCAIQRGEPGSESGVQEPGGCGAHTFGECVSTEHGRRGLAKLQQNIELRPTLATEPDQHEERRRSESSVHIRRWRIRCLRVRSDHG